jgi:hypothetical protein
LHAALAGGDLLSGVLLKLERKPQEPVFEPFDGVMASVEAILERSTVVELFLERSTR